MSTADKLFLLALALGLLGGAMLLTTPVYGICVLLAGALVFGRAVGSL